MKTFQVSFFFNFSTHKDEEDNLIKKEITAQSFLI